MKIYSLLTLLFSSLQLIAQTPEGSWKGEISAQGMKLKIVFHLEQSNNIWSGKMDSPDQNAFDIPIEKVAVVKDSVFISDNRIKLNYKGKLQDNQIDGKFTQGFFSTKLVLTPGKTSKPNRPQTPIGPFNYKEEELIIKNEKDNIELAGTLTFPKNKKKAPLAILISGSGAQDRDETLFNHKPFAVIADYLTNNGYAVFRFDDRGTAKSTGDFLKANSFDFASDVEAILNFFLTRKDINSKQIGLIGHSEGGLIAGIVAANNPKIAFVISLAGPGVKGNEILEVQSYLIGKDMGLPEEQLQQAKKINKALYGFIEAEDWKDFDYSADRVIRKYKLIQPEVATFKNEELIQQILPPNINWFKTFLITNPIDFYNKIKAPVFAINGEKDIQVNYNQNIPPLKQSFSNKKSSSKIYPKLNHLFQHATTGSVNEYKEIEETISPEVLNDIITWLKNIKIK